MIRVLTIITLTIPLSGCLTTQQAYLPDGSLGYEIRCDGTAFSMADCQRQAGEICKSRGYTIYDKNGEAYHTSSAAIGPYGGQRLLWRDCAQKPLFEMRFRAEPTMRNFHENP